MMKKECRVVIYKEGLLGSLFFGEAKAALFWSREAYLFVLERPL